ncbi:MAG: thioredoxin domain-containing protein [Deltaproteobacteria bacterium]|nr:thioredoxin domain-containing protein [Deltaproteobacteria bacterium]
MPPSFLRSLLVPCALAALAACGSPPGVRPSTTADRAASPARVSVSDSRSSSDSSEEGTADRDVPAWPATSGLPGADAERVRIPVAGRPALGPRDASVTVVIFSDFECPFCSRVVPTLTRLVETFPDDVRLVFRNRPLPFHRQARPAAAAALEAFAQQGDEGFWQMHDLLFDNQQALSQADLEAYATGLGLDLPRFRQALDGRLHDVAIGEDDALAERVGARGTPTFFINGRKLVGAQPFTAFEQIVDEEIVIARYAIDRGLDRRDVYASVQTVAVDVPTAPPSVPRAAARPSRRLDPSAVHYVPLGNSPSRGPADALVTIVEISDFQCPFCSRVQPTLSDLEQRYGRDLRIVFKHNPLPFHQEAPNAHRAALEAFAQRGNRGFWDFHDLLFQNQQAIDRDDLDAYARRTRLNMRRFKRAMGRGTHQGAIDQDMALAASLGARGTPAFFINGRYIAGAQPLAAFTAIVDEELSRARERVAAGTPRARIYAERIDGAPRSLVYVDGEGAGLGANAGAPPRPPSVYSIAVPQSVPSRGAVGAPVTLQVFSDFQCVFCSRLGPTLDAIEREYRGRVRIVFRNYPLPFHQDAPAAHRAALEVFRQGGDAKFWEYHDVLFRNQRALGRSDLLSYARVVGGIDLGELEAALDGGRHQDVIDADIEAIRAAGARIGTPSTFVNGHLLQGAHPIEAFRQLIDAQIAEASP